MLNMKRRGKVAQERAEHERATHERELSKGKHYDGELSMRERGGLSMRERAKHETEG